MISLFNILIIFILLFMIIFISYYNSVYINFISNHKNYNINNIYFIDNFDRYNSIIMENLDERCINIIKYNSYYSLENIIILSQVYKSKCSIFYLDSDIKQYINDDVLQNITIINYGIIGDLFNYINKIIINNYFFIDKIIYKKYGMLQNIITSNLSILPDILIYDNNYYYISYYTLITMAMLTFDNSDILSKNIDLNTYNNIINTSRIIKKIASNIDMEYFEYIIRKSDFLFKDNTINLIRRKDFIGYKTNNMSLINNKILLYKNIAIITNYIKNEKYFGNCIIIKKHYIDYINKLTSGCLYIENNNYDIEYKFNKNIYKNNIILYNNYILKKENKIININNDILLYKYNIINKLNIDYDININKNIDNRIVSNNHIITIDKKYIYDKNIKIYNCNNISIYDNIYGNIFYKFDKISNIYINFINTNIYNYYYISIINPKNIIIEYNIN
ncbi:similar to translation elongation factor eEF-3 [Betaentomopoxvirus amoorei]|uniref:AMV238 n=1 Tax=Amsacta moorei entomopoxvirus TaxID=28321 RepID=Q9EMG8_AMEPV|nr:similar to translation elongation factor eEF-3 [Amsacta moorei entomopoxvirus]AAG02944.1 AMV238 [Amsacta moorei entomopoxvirus]